MNKLSDIRKQKHIASNNRNYPVVAYNKNSSGIQNILEFLENVNREEFTYLNFFDGSNLHFFTIAGRIKFLRKNGGIAFAKLVRFDGYIQVIFSKNTTQSFDKITNLDIADIVEVVGAPVFSKTGEKSLLVSKYRLLTKSIALPPEKHSGFEDQELKYKRRYMDAFYDPYTMLCLKARSIMYSSIRSVMSNYSYLEVDTPILSSIASGASAKPFKTHHNALDEDLYLRIAPELYLKRMVVAGFDRVYEIGKNFRNEGLSNRHNPEFSMIEFYSAYSDTNHLIQVVISIINEVQKNILLNSNFLQNISIDKAHTLRKKIESRTYDLSNYTTVTMVDSIKNSAEKRNIQIDENYFVVNNVQLNNKLNECPTKGHRIGKLFEEIVEPYLTADYVNDGKSMSVFVTDFPYEISPLARRKDNSEFCDRFELYVDGKELVNGFQELNDPEVQKQNFISQLNDDEHMDYDDDYINALEFGLPPTAGCGIGLDRLLMLVLNASSIKEVLTFTTR